MRKHKIDKIKVHKRQYLILEIFLAVFLAVGCGIIGMSDLLWVSNDKLPGSNALTQMTKAIYLAKELLLGHIPGWFPFWFNGSDLTQYDSPLTYFILAPIYLVTGQVLLTFKIYCAGVMAVGGLGVWVFCRRNIGRFCGLVGLTAYCLQPFLLSSLYRDGRITYGLIYAILPWFLLSVLSCAKKPGRGNFFGTVVLGSLLIFTNVMITIMVFFVILLTFLFLIITKKMILKDFMITLAGLLFAVMLTVFWFLIGADGVGNPSAYLNQQDTVSDTAAYIGWFLPGSLIYFSLEVLTLSTLAAIFYLIATLLKQNRENCKFHVLACILVIIVTIAFSFGLRLPGFQFLPFAYEITPGRILILTSVTGAVCSAYAIYCLWSIQRVRFLLRFLALALFAVLCYELNPYHNSYQGTITQKNTMINAEVNGNNSFEKGRYEWFKHQNDTDSFFAAMNNYNLSNGGVIENTPQKQVLNNSQVALALSKSNYLIKQAAFWNVRYMKLPDQNAELGMKLFDELGFHQVKSQNGFTLYESNQPSSYFLTDNRNALVISKEMQGFSVQFPYFIQGYSKNLWDYSLKELLKYKLIYIIEPELQTRSQIKRFETMVIRLINSGVTVIIEPVGSKSFEIFDVHIEDEKISSDPTLTATSECPFTLPEKQIVDNSELTTVRNLCGLDKVYANFEFKNGCIKTPILGTKKVGKGNVIFVGAHLSQYLGTVYSRNSGIGKDNTIIMNNSDSIETVYRTLFMYYGVCEEYLPQSFTSITKQSWDYQGGSFTYQSNENKEVVVSVTYTPRWTASVDGSRVEIGQREKLLMLNLPAGKHIVKLHYGITQYGKIGTIISAAGLFLLLFLMIFWNFFMKHVENRRRVLRDYLQLNEEKLEAGELESDENEFSLEEVAAAMEEISLTDEVKQVSEASYVDELENVTRDVKEQYEADPSKSDHNTSDQNELVQNKSEHGQTIQMETENKKENPDVIRKTVIHNGIKVEVIDLGVDKISDDNEERSKSSITKTAEVVINKTVMKNPNYNRNDEFSVNRKMPVRKTIEQSHHRTAVRKSQVSRNGMRINPVWKTGYEKHKKTRKQSIIRNSTVINKNREHHDIIKRLKLDILRKRKRKNKKYSALHLNKRRNSQ